MGGAQNEKVRADQVQNHAGGYVFQADLWHRLDRFLVLGSEGGTYYASERAQTLEHVGVVIDCASADAKRTVDRIVAISEAGRAPKNDPAIAALAVVASSDAPEARRLALEALPRVCRTGTHLFHFVAFAEELRRWGRGLRRAVGAWYNALPPEQLALQVAKYPQRDGWSHRDLLRLAHPTPASAAHNAVFRWVAGGGAAALAAETKRGAAPDRATLPPMLAAVEELRGAKQPKQVARLVRDFRLSHEMVPSEWKSDRDVWAALLEDMPVTATLRSLAKMTEVGLLRPLSNATGLVVRRLGDADKLRRARVHPLAILGALKVYASGKGARGQLTWTPVPAIVEALDRAFRLAFRSVEPTGKRHLVALDVSGSMTFGAIGGMPGITPRVGSAAMALVTLAAERDCHVMGFSHELAAIALRPSMSLEEVIATIEQVPMGGTDCALPMVWATKAKAQVDTFVVYTDSETWFGATHPFRALRDYRQRMGIPAKLVVVGMTATQFTIADPTDTGMLDVVGFDTAAPAILADFARGAADA
jgi:60 kDa SS-A/Ro ribonucleoprotein